MNNAQLSIDKASIEYHGVTVNFYNRLALSFRDWFDIKPVIRHRGYVYHWNLGMDGAYLYLQYQPWWQKKSRKYTLQIETHPEYLVKFRTLLDALYGHSQEVYFNRCELAYDFPYPMGNIFLASNTGRNMNVYEGTRYFGKKKDSKGHAFCWNYDKKAEWLCKGGMYWESEREWSWFIRLMRKYHLRKSSNFLPSSMTTIHVALLLT